MVALATLPDWTYDANADAIAREFGFKTIACASTGNLANSVSAHAARAGMEPDLALAKHLCTNAAVAARPAGEREAALDGLCAGVYGRLARGIIQSIG